MARKGVISLVVPGSLHRITGGNVYDEVVLGALQARGWETQVVEPGRIPSSSDLVIVDSLAFQHRPARTNAPTVALVHQLAGEANGREGRAEAERSALQGCHRVIAVSEWLRRRLETITRSPIEVISPGRDRCFVASSSSLEDGLVLCVGNAEPEKGVSQAIEAAGVAGRPGSTMVVVGDLEADPREAQMIHAVASAAGPRVLLAGVLSPRELADLYSKARVFVTASRYEGWPIAVAEAMASGVPVVGFDIPGLRELVRPGTDGLLVAPGDVAALGRAVAALLSNRTLAAALGASARERAMGWLTWQECGERFADTIEGVIRLKRSGAGDASRSEVT
jgi:glycosyltransferase involved in cell wall biosynthesis